MRQNIHNNGGQWLYGVFNTGSGEELTNYPMTSFVSTMNNETSLVTGSKLTGFIHNEDHYWVENGLIGQFTGNGKAYKSISLGVNIF